MITTNKKQKYQIGETVKFKNGTIGIIEYSYAQAFGSHSDDYTYNEYSILFLDEKGKPSYSSSWHSAFVIEKVIDVNLEKGLKTIRKYNSKIEDSMDVPMYMNGELHDLIGYKI